MIDIVISMGLTGAMLAMLGMGLLISYYGSSKTRNVGLFFLVIGIGLAYYITSIDDSTVHFGNAFIAFIGGMLGGIIGIVVFLIAIIKS